MCGIFGVALGEGPAPGLETLKSVVARLFVLSEARGKESSGFAIRTPDRMGVYKEAIPASELIRSRRYGELLSELATTSESGHDELNVPLALIAHSRLVTNGLQTTSENNQPVFKDGLVAVHNGIITNDEQLWQRYPDMQRECEVDTEVLLSLIGRFEAEGLSLVEAVRRVFREIQGAASIGILLDDRPFLLLATNTGSLYMCQSERPRLMLFASERHILEQLPRSRRSGLPRLDAEVRQLEAGSAMLVHLPDLKSQCFPLEARGGPSASVPVRADRPVAVVNYSGTVSTSVAALRRCSRCVLPETFPFIEYDEEGVCNYCRAYKPFPRRGREELEKALAPYRSKDGSPDCIVAFSGGRDSSYGLHLLKQELGMNPVTFTYDWGLVTDLARRNQARLCGKLGVEHILISADITRKRRNVRKNVEAWLKRPELGMIPLFMAGDKQFFYHANRLRKQLGIDLVLFCTCPLETTHFKTGFCGVDSIGEGMYFSFPLKKTLLVASYYLKQYLVNPRYWNSSLPDTIGAFASAFFMAPEWLDIFDFVLWDEREIETTLLGEYDWETAPDTRSTWRIGDGTAAFYNYLYYKVAGFTEHDTFRSNQIREGLIGRDEALASVNTENRPRWDSMMAYARTIGFDFTEAIKVINAIPPLYRAVREICPRSQGSTVRAA